MLTHKKSLLERLFHALVFEMIAIALTAAFMVWAMGLALQHAGGLATAISLIAMAWNMLFNAGFDRAQATLGFRRTLVARVVHSLLFELGLTVAIVPLAAWWLNISLWQALWLDIGLLIFFLFYNFVYNWCYDHLRARLLAAAAV